MGYSTDDSVVRVDFFKPSGKWYCTEAVKWTGEYETGIHESFAKSLRDHLNKGEHLRLSGLNAICLEPYHKNGHPLMLTQGAWNLMGEDE